MAIVPALTSEPELISDTNSSNGGVQSILSGTNKLFFTANDAETGTETWISDGTKIGTRLLRDIAPGRANASPRLIVTTGSRTWFGATTSTTGQEPWFSDGTGSGTRLVGDLNLGTRNGQAAGSNPSAVIDLGAGSFLIVGELPSGNSGLFRCTTTGGDGVLVKDLGSSGFGRDGMRIPGTNKALIINANQAWISDGTSAGTTLLALSGTDAFLSKIVATQNGLFFGESGSSTHFYFSDGTQANTRLIEVGTTYKFAPAGSGSNLVFSAGSFPNRSLRASDGTQAGTVVLRSTDADYQLGGVSNSEYWISASDGPGITALWRSNGTAGGTVKVIDGIYTWSGFQVVTAAGKTWFTGYTQGSTVDIQLYSSDGTAGGTQRTQILNFVGDTSVGLSVFSRIAAVNANVFISDRGRLVGVDATSKAVTMLYTSMYSDRDGNPQYLTAFNGKLLFFSDQNPNPLGAEDARPFIYDPNGSAAPFQLSAIRNPANPVGDSPHQGPFLAVGSTAIFGAQSNQFPAVAGQTGYEPWRTDGTVAGTVLLKDINPGVGHSNFLPLGLAPGSTSKALALAGQNTGNLELWATDGSSGGTVLVKDINPGNPGSFPLTYLDMGAYAIFTAISAGQGRELWRTDGTAAGTTLVKDIAPGANSGIGADPNFLRQPVRVGETAYFLADSGSTGPELWKTDGTVAGTTLVKDILPGAVSSDVKDMTAFAGKLFFTANDGVNGRELWVSDGTSAGTTMVVDILPGPGSACNALPVSGNPTFGTGCLAVSGGRLWFAANDGIHGLELWSSDGTAVGTTLFRDINPGSDGSDLYGMIDVAGVLCFAANNGETGLELWQSDGTVAGTYLAGDINTGPDDSFPFYRDSLRTQVGVQIDNTFRPDAAVMGGTLYFSARAASVGRELWRYTPSRTANPGGIIALNSSTYSGSEGSGQAVITLTRTGGTGNASVTFSTTAGSAQSVADFTPFSGAVNFSAGETSKSVVIPVVNDGISEPAENFTVTITSPTGGATLGLAAATVTITDGGSANQPPIATAQSLSTAINTPLSITFSGSDPDGTPVTVAGIGQPSAGTIAGTGSTRTFTPPSGFTGVVTISFTVTDGVAVSNPATVTVNVNSAANQAPIAYPQSVVTSINTAIAIVFSGSDPEGSTVVTAATTSPAHGTLIGNGTTLVRTYQPNPGYIGTDTFTFTVSDGVLISAPATVTITVGAAGSTVVASLSYVLSGTVPDGASAVKLVVGGVATSATITPLTGSNRIWTGTITAPTGTKVATVQFIAPDNSVKSRTFNLVR